MRIVTTDINLGQEYYILSFNLNEVIPRRKLIFQKLLAQFLLNLI